MSESLDGPNVRLDKRILYVSLIHEEIISNEGNDANCSIIRSLSDVISVKFFQCAQIDKCLELLLGATKEANSLHKSRRMLEELAFYANFRSAPPPPSSLQTISCGFIYLFIYFTQQSIRSE